MSIEVGASLLLHPSRVWTHTRTIFSSVVHVVLKHEGWVLSAIKAHSVILVSNGRKSSD